jgi:hypothetical protein
MIAIGLPLIFRARDYIRIAGVVMVLIGVVGLIVLRAS